LPEHCGIGRSGVFGKAFHRPTIATWRKRKAPTRPLGPNRSSNR
jgi:hypothetical protein